jgi:hypothetical protein
MSSRSIFYMTFAVLAGFAVILAMNVAKAFKEFAPRYLSPNDVRGMAIEHNNLLYTLNFEQQNAVLQILNQSVPIGPQISPKEESPLKPAFERLVIYRFQAPDIEIRPVAYARIVTAFGGEGPTQQDLLVFSAPIWNRTGLMQETTARFKDLLSQTYDP